MAFGRHEDDRALIGMSAPGNDLGALLARNWMEAFAMWLAALGAVMVREMRGRFATDPLGHLWTFLTPAFWIVSLSFAFSLMGRNIPIDADMNSFLITGVLPYMIFRTTVLSMMRMARGQEVVLHLPAFRHSDILIAAAVLELVNAVVLGLVFFGGNAFIHGTFSLDDPLTTLIGLVLAWALGASFGTAAAILAQGSPLVERVVPLLLRPLFWISGIFFVAAELPQRLVHWLSWNPLLHAIEIVRSGAFGGYDSPIAALGFPVVCVIGLLLFAAWLRLHQSVSAAHG